MKSHASMNRIYRLVWNAALNLWVAVAENAKGRGKSGSARNKAALLMLVPLSALMHQARAADAANATVSAGTASVATAGNTTTINQASQRAAIDWTSLSTRANEALIFNQPNAHAIALNRITGSSPSELLGSLTSNGQVFILNPNGVLFGAGSQVNVGGLVASTLSMSNADFMAGKHVFTGSAGSGSVVNQGTLNAAPGGYLALLAPEVRNEGVMTASLGTALLAAGNKITLNLDNGSLLGYSIDQGAINALAENKQLIKADGGQVLLGARALDSLTTATVNNTGVIEAKTLQNKAGRILLMGDMSYGTVNVAGTLDASAPAGGDGGFIETSAAHVKVAAGTRVSTLSGTGKTGTWLVDPTDFTISSGSGSQTSSGIGADTLSANLATTSVTLATDASTGSDSGDINVNAAVTWSANTILALNAYNNININAAITATGTSAGLVLNHGNYATAGSVTSGTDYKVSAPVTLSGANATLAINGTSYTLIHSMAALDAIDSTGLSGKYALAGDLDASGTTYTSALVRNAFNGTFAGLGHGISNLVIVAGSFTGLFSRAGSGSVIRDIGLVGGSVSGDGIVGGLVGQNFGSISNAYATGSVSGTDYVGGLVGLNTGSISNVYATGDVSGNTRVGGLAGQNSGSISSAYATGSISGRSDYVGGLAGDNYGSISNAYATGSVSGTSSYVGGLVGYNGGSISNVYATGSVSGDSQVGGLVGYNLDSISNAYATGSVSGSNSVGGLVGSNDGSISNTYWDTTTGQSAAVGVDSGTTTNVNAIDSSSAYSHSSYANFGTWAETASGSGVWVANDGSGKAWVLIEGSTRPFLYSEYSTSIHNAHQLQLMAADTSASYTLARNIDASETSGSNASGMWTTAGFASVGNRNEAFSGTLDGQGHTVNDLSIVRSTDDVGLIGYAGGATVQNIGLQGGSVSGGTYVGSLVGTLAGGSVANAYSTATVSGSGDNVGGLVGLNAAGSVSNAYSTGQVTGSASNVGGLVGTNAYGGTISDAYSSSVVTGVDSVGGLVGKSLAGGGISNAYATGSVSGGSYVGGLVGENYSSISDAYAIGSVSGSQYYVGGLVGENHGSISDAHAIGNVSGSNYAGGLVGSNSGSISNAHATTGSVSGSGYVGGLVGYNYGGSIDTAYATGSVSGSASVGGLVGVNEGSIRNAYATGNVSGSGDYAGGLVGFNSHGSISNAYATGNVSGGAYDVGGLVGANSYGIIDTAYAIGSVSGVYYVGGLAGENYEGSISNAYATGSVSGTDYVGGLVGSAENATLSNTYSSGAVSGSSDVGGLLGFVWSGVTVTSSYWNTDTSGQSSSAGGTGLSSAQMLQAGSFSGWDIATSGGSTSVWRIYENHTAPLLRSFMTALTVSADSSSKTYDGTTSISSGYSLSDASADTSLILGTAAYSTSSKNVGSNSIGISGLYSGQQGYDIRYVNGTATITAATLTVSGGSAANKTYDGTTAATVSGGSLSGLVSGDTVSLSQSGTFSDKNAATGKTVSYTSSLSGTDAGNYVLASGSGTATADITAAALTVTANDDTQLGGSPYSGGNGVSYNGLVTGDTAAAVLAGSLAYGGSAQGAYLAGEYDITAGGLLANGNYSLRFVQGKLTLSSGDAATAALGGTALVGAYQASLNSVSSGSLVPRVSVDDSKGGGEGGTAAGALNAAAAEGAGQDGGN
jgi:filamentous hemagglutinin family protein